MSWKERTVEEVREEFVKRVLAHEKSKRALCLEYGISRPTGDKWIKRYLEGESMSDQSRAPHNRPNQVTCEMEEKIVAMRKKYPAIGATKMHKMMENEGIQELPCARTFNNIFHRHDLITSEASSAATPYQRFEKVQPNEMWQADFKGHFAMKNQKRCHPLNIVDDYSRFCLCCEAQLDETFASIKPVLQRLFQEYGMPLSFLCDNGNPWGTVQSMGFTQLEVWMMELGILVLHGRVRHPQTQGKDERFNRSFTRECLKYHEFTDEGQAQKIFSEYRNFYNYQRPHCALKMEVPATRYHPSERKYPEKIEEWEYPAECQLCKVKSTGYFNYKGQGYFLSEAFGGKTIAVRESHLPGQITLLFRQFRIGRIDLEARVYTLRRAYRLEGDPRTQPRP